MNALYLDTNSMFNFDELYARIHELDGIKDPQMSSSLLMNGKPT